MPILPLTAFAILALVACAGNQITGPTLAGNWTPVSAQLGGADFPVANFPGGILKLTSETYDRARQISERHQLGFWDAVIVASALIARCTVLLTEDLQHGQRFEGLMVRNPFRSAG